MNNDYIQDFLMHHGVKGMKWGVVKEYDKSNNKTSKNKWDDDSSDFNPKNPKYQEARKKVIKDLEKSSNDNDKKLLEMMKKDTKDTNEVVQEMISNKMVNDDEKAINKMNDALTNKKYDLLKKYDSSDEDKKYFKDDEPLDDYENIIEDLESYAKSNGHINIDEKDINEYKELVKQQNELNDKIYGSNKEKQKIRSGRVATGAILGTIGGLGISALGLRIANRNVLRTPKTVRKGKAILISMGILGATIGSISGVASANHKIKQSK